jgi:hypothetical protein
VPGLAVANRNNHAQDLQISSRGFGARASFGVRGLPLYNDGIPASGPDRQGLVSNFDLAGDIGSYGLSQWRVGLAAPSEGGFSALAQEAQAHDTYSPFRPHKEPSR